MSKLLIADPSFLRRFRKETKDFTRVRKMGFKELMFFLLSMINESSQNALERFFKKVGKETRIKQQSFSEARQKIEWEAFKELCERITDEIYTGYYETWNGFRVSAIDGTKVALPSDEQLRQYFGTTGAGSTSVTGQGSILYDVYNKVIIDAQLEPMSCDERTQAEMHIRRLLHMPSFGKELIIFDRGYASFELIRRLEKLGISYLMRVRDKFNTDIDKMTGSDGKVTLRSKQNETLKVRVIKFKLKSGVSETLITNLRGKRYDIAAFKELYFKRWPVETKYDELKNKLAIENFSGRTETAVRQDFHASMYLSNIAAAFYWEAQEKVIEEQKDKNNKYEYHVNVNHAIGVLKDDLVKVFVESDIEKRGSLLDDIIVSLKSRITPYRPGRSIPRNPNPRKVKYHHNQKSNC